MCNIAWKDGCAYKKFRRYGLIMKVCLLVRFCAMLTAMHAQIMFYIRSLSQRIHPLQLDIQGDYETLTKFLMISRIELCELYCNK